MESFCLQKVSGGVHFTPCGTTSRCYDHALRKEPSGRWFAGGRENAHTPERESPRANRGPVSEAGAVYRSCGEGGLTGTVGASRDVDVASGMETRCPVGAGQRQLAGSVRSMTARPDAYSKGRTDSALSTQHSALSTQHSAENNRP